MKKILKSFYKYIEANNEKVLKGLLIVHIILALWAAIGLLELLFFPPPWPKVSNPNFTSTILLLQWEFTLLTAGLFIFGYFNKWKGTPISLAFAYGALASLCAYETIFLMKSSLRFIAMFVEYCSYFAIITFLFKSKISKKYFKNSLEKIK